MFMEHQPTSDAKIEPHEGVCKSINAWLWNYWIYCVSRVSTLGVSGETRILGTNSTNCKKAIRVKIIYSYVRLQLREVNARGMIHFVTADFNQ